MGGLSRLTASVHGGGNMTLREYISFWQEAYDRHQSRATTYAAHNYVFKNHILPGLGDIQRIPALVKFRAIPIRKGKVEQDAVAVR